MNNTHDSLIADNNSVIEYVSNLNNSTQVHVNNRTWLLDNGVSCHIETYKILFLNLYPLQTKPFIFLPDGTK